MNWSDDAVKSLRTALIRLYRDSDDARIFADQAGLNSSKIDIGNKRFNAWHNILDYAQKRGKLDQVLEQALIDEPEDQILLQIKEGNPPKIIEGNKITDWKGTGSSSKLEKMMGARSTLVDIAYFEQGLTCAKPVVRIMLDNSMGSGFLTNGNLLITNNHVIPNKKIAEQAVVQFNYQKKLDGLSTALDEYRLVIDTFKTSKEHDWSIVKVDGNPEATWGALPLVNIDDSEINVGDFVNIIQHPKGAHKQVSLSASVVVGMSDNVVQYLTDTFEGSSGSPVFDADWNVVALHHSGGMMEEPDVMSKREYFRNEGININRVIEGLDE